MLKTRGRRSAASYEAPAPIIDTTRPEPPETLPQAGRELWVAIVYSYDPEYFAPPHLPLLEAFVRAVLMARECDRLLDAEGLFVDGRQHPALELRAEAVRQMASLAVKLRISISSAVRGDAAKLRPSSTPRRKLWDRGFDHTEEH